MNERIIRLTVVVTLAFIGLFVFAACGAATPSINATDTKVIDGVTCIIYNSNNSAGGISCNWEAYNAGK